MSKAKNASVGIINQGSDEVLVWCAKFTIKGNFADEAGRRHLEKKIAKVLEETNFEE